MTAFAELVQRALVEARAALREVVREEVREVVHAEMAAAQSMPDPAELVDLKEAARIVGKTEQALRRSVERHSFPVKPVRVGRLLRFRRRDLVTLAAGEKVKR